MSATLPSEVKEGAKSYLSAKEIPQLFESLTAGLLHHRPEDPVLFVQDCLAHVKNNPDVQIKWNMFIEWKPPEGNRPRSSGY